MADFVIVHILDEYETGKQFSMWPLHVTLLPWFDAPDANGVVEALTPLLEKSAPINVQLGDFAKLGAKRTARMLITSTDLKTLHEQLLKIVEDNGWPIRGRYTGSHFSPHITRTSGRDYNGDGFVIDSLHIAEALPMGKRRLVARLPLRKSVIQ